VRQNSTDRAWRLHPRLSVNLHRKSLTSSETPDKLRVHSTAIFTRDARRTLWLWPGVFSQSQTGSSIETANWIELIIDMRATLGLFYSILQ